MWLSQAAIRRPVLTTVALIIVLVLGAVSLAGLQLDLIPNINPPVGAVVTSYPGAGPEEVLEKVTKPLESNLGTLSGLETLQSQTQEGMVLILLEFGWSEDIQDKQNDILSRISQTELPDDAGEPSFLKFDPSAIPIMQLSVTEGRDSEQFREDIDDMIQSLTNLSGVASINESGLLNRQVHVELDADELNQLHLTQSDIKNVLQAHNVSLPGGIVEEGDHDLTSRVIGEIPDVDTLKNLQVAMDPRDGETVTLADVADIEISEEERTTITRTNQEPSVSLNVFKQADANTAEVSNAVNEELEQINDDKQVKVVSIFDQGAYVEQAVGNVSNAMIGGGLLAMLILFLFLRTFKSPLMIGVAIPVSVIVTFVLMFFADFSLNIMTLGGLALGIGMLVDNAIVVIENIYRHLEEEKPPKQAAAEGAGEVAGAITASTLTTVAVFLPVVFVSGIVGTIFREFAITVAFSLLASLLVALTIVPVMAAAMLKKPRKNLEKARKQSSFYTGYREMVEWAVNHRKSIVTITLIMLLIGGAGVWTVGTEFLPATDEGVINAEVALPAGTGLSQTEEVAEDVEAILADERDVENFLTTIGSGQSFGGSSGRNIAQIYVNLVDLEQRNRSTTQIMDDLRDEMEDIHQDASVTLTAQSSMSMGGEPNTLGFMISGDDQLLEDWNATITEALHDLSNVSDVSNSKTETQPELHVRVNREDAREHGLAPAQVVTAVSNATRGEVVTGIADDSGNELDVLLSYGPTFTESPDALQELPISSGEETVLLSDVAEVEVADGPITINRHNLQSTLEYTVQFSNTNLGQIEAAVKQELADLDLPEDLDVQFTGAAEMFADSIDDLGLAAVLSVLLVFLVLAGQFESFKYPLVILFTLPLMVIGVALGLFVTQTPVGITAMIGIIVLAGIVVNNAIVLVDYINKLKERGFATYDAIVEASVTRFRPILMTATTTALGLLPLSLGIGEGTEIQQPLAIAVIGGLASSTLLTLIVIPVVYSWFDPETRYGYTYHPARPPRRYRDADGDAVPALTGSAAALQQEDGAPKRLIDRWNEAVQLSQEGVGTSALDTPRDDEPDQEVDRKKADRDVTKPDNDGAGQTTDADLSQEEMFDLMSKMLDVAKKLPHDRDQEREDDRKHHD